MWSEKWPRGTEVASESGAAVLTPPTKRTTRSQNFRNFSISSQKSEFRFQKFPPGRGRAGICNGQNSVWVRNRRQSGPSGAHSQSSTFLSSAKFAGNARGPRKNRDLLHVLPFGPAGDCQGSPKLKRGALAVCSVGDGPQYGGGQARVETETSPASHSRAQQAL